METECNSALEKKNSQRASFVQVCAKRSTTTERFEKKFGSSLQVLGDGEEKYSSIKRI